VGLVEGDALWRADKLNAKKHLDFVQSMDGPFVLHYAEKAGRCDIS
jgi:hypothetical protein